MYASNHFHYGINNCMFKFQEYFYWIQCFWKFPYFFVCHIISVSLPPLPEKAWWKAIDKAIIQRHNRLLMAILQQLMWDRFLRLPLKKKESWLNVSLLDGFANNSGHSLKLPLNLHRRRKLIEDRILAGTSEVLPT